MLLFIYVNTHFLILKKKEVYVKKIFKINWYVKMHYYLIDM